jgi:hypothetical protein
MRTTASRVGRAVAAVVTAVATLTVVAAQPAAPATTSQPKVVLLESGSAPRTEMRLALTAGMVIESDTVFTTAVKQTIDGTSAPAASIPPMLMTEITTVESVGADGNAEITYTYGDVEVVDDGSVSDAMREQLETALEPLTELTGRATVTPRNEYLDESVAGIESLPDVPAQIFQQVGQRTSLFVVPFPLEAVGVGARWRATTLVEVSGIRVRQQYEYRLRDRVGDRVTLDVSFEQTAPRQRAKLPGVPPSARVEITKWRGTGSGSSTLELTTPFPAELQNHMTSTQEFSARYRGDSSQVALKITTDITASSAPAE